MIRSIYIVIFLIVFLCFPNKSIENRKKSEEFDLKRMRTVISKLCDEILHLDNDITWIMRNCTKGKGEELQNKMKTYNKDVWRLLNFTKEYKYRVLGVAENLLYKEGPDFIEVDFDKEKMTKNFKWKEIDFNNTYDIRIDTYRSWTALLTLKDELMP